MLPGTSELLIILGVCVLLFGAKKLPALGGAVGESIRNFRKGIRSIGDEGVPSTEVKDRGEPKA